MHNHQFLIRPKNICNPNCTGSKIINFLVFFAKQSCISLKCYSMLVTVVCGYSLYAAYCLVTFNDVERLLENTHVRITLEGFLDQNFALGLLFEKWWKNIWTCISMCMDNFKCCITLEVWVNLLCKKNDTFDEARNASGRILILY